MAGFNTNNSPGDVTLYVAQAGCQLQVIYVPEGFEVREGLKLTKDYKVVCSRSAIKHLLKHHINSNSLSTI